MTASLTEHDLTALKNFDVTADEIVEFFASKVDSFDDVKTNSTASHIADVVSGWNEDCFAAKGLEDAVNALFSAVYALHFYENAEDVSEWLRNIFIFARVKAREDIKSGFEAELGHALRGFEWVYVCETLRELFDKCKNN